MKDYSTDTDLSLPFLGALFDLDGVITSTDIQHFSAWKRMFEQDAGVKEFSHHDYLEYVDGKKRLDGLTSLLTAKSHQFSHDEATQLGEIKQRYYLEEVDKGGIKVFTSTVDLIHKLKNHGIKQAVVSSSRNAKHILERVGLNKLFEVIISGDHVISHEKEEIVELAGKPAPDLFLRSCQELGLSTQEVIGFEDALSGIEALQNAGIFSVAIDRKNSPKLQNSGADLLVKDLSEVSIEALIAAFQQKQT